MLSVLSENHIKTTNVLWQIAVYILMLKPVVHVATPVL
jgi:hypothetical protein